MSIPLFVWKERRDGVGKDHFDTYHNNNFMEDVPDMERKWRR